MQKFGNIFFKLASVLLHPAFLPIYLALDLKFYFRQSLTAGIFYIILTPIIALLIKYILDLLTTSKAAKEENQFEYKGNLIQRVDAFVSDKYSRVVACLSYPITVLTFARIINSYYQLEFFPRYLLLMAMASLFCAVISLFWRISIHAYGWGAAMSIFLMRNLNFCHYPRFYIVFLLIGGGLAMASRLYLKRHTTLQVYLGYAVGLISGILITLIYGSIF